MDLRYPIGQYEPAVFTQQQKDEWIADIKFLPNRLEAALQNLDEAQLHTPYRPGGWTVHQLVHHIADSHMHAYLRFKLAYTDPGVTITPYNEADWVLLQDVKALPVNVSTTLLFALHQRWAQFLSGVQDGDWLTKSVFHPEKNKQLTLWHLLGMYAWHGLHHVAHINNLREREGW